MPARLLAIAAALMLLPGAAAAAETVDAGSLRVSVEQDPWRLVFSDSRGVLLSEAGSSGAGSAGKLGFQGTGGVWRHATRVTSESRDGSAYTATLATDDPGGATIAVRVEPSADGVLSVTATVSGGATRTGIAFETAAGERYLGFGERSNAVDQRGRDVESFVADGPYLRAERPFVNAFVPTYANRDRDESTYYPIPWLLSTRGYGVLVDGHDLTMHRLGTGASSLWSVETDSRTLVLRVFAGPRPAEVLERFSAYVGRQPPAAAPFFFGPWWQPKDGEQRSIDVMREADAPASVVNTYTHYLPCGDQRTAAERERTARFHAAGLAVTTYFNPMICTDYQPRYDEAKAANVLTKNAQGQPYEYRYAVTNQFVVGQFDFTAPGAVEFYGRLLQEAVDDGYDGWMEDFGEYSPPDAVSHDGTPGPAMHNRYPELYHGAAHAFSKAAPRPLARFNRSGWTRAARESQIVWGGDPTTDWGYDGLESALWQGLTMGLSGVSLWGSNIGGFFSNTAPQLSPELLKRWVQLGAVSGVMRTEANGVTIPPKSQRRAQVFDEGVLPVWRRYAKFRTQLYPYLYAAQAEYDESGLPIMRHLALTHPGDPAAVARDDEFMFGPDLLAAPVVRPGQTQREAYLPPGLWVDFWKAVSYREDDGSFPLGRAVALRGGRTRTSAAPDDVLPLYVRAGAVIPMLPADVDTLADYGDAPEIVNLRERNGRILLALPRGRSRANLGEGARSLSMELRGRRWVLQIRGERRRTWRIQASLSTLRRSIRPCRVLNGRRPLSRKRWRYDRAARVLHITVRDRSPRIDVRGRC
ncbi:MAG TPA: TIM-barrel domain-containing protein [Thermoleophilaceae bacterium]|nr:TIM-barrel domain-containing protein [Thermoleophilaceae bacterium]